MNTETLQKSLEARDYHALDRVYTEDVLFDAHVPHWRFQIQGRDAVVDLLRRWFPNPGRFTLRQQWTTTDGDALVQLEWHEDTPDGEITVRELQLLRLDGDRIAEQLVYCADRWDEAHVADMRRQAPLVKP